MGWLSLYRRYSYGPELPPPAFGLTGFAIPTSFGAAASGTYLYSGDSNYDWGQGLPELDRWQEEHAQPQVAVWYFGQPFCLDSRRYHPLDLGGVAVDGPGGVREQVRGRIVAVSLTLLYAQGDGTAPVWFRANSRSAAHGLISSMISPESRRSLSYRVAGRPLVEACRLGDVLCVVSSPPPWLQSFFT